MRHTTPTTPLFSCRYTPLQVDNLLRQKPPSVQHVLDSTLHLLPEEVLDAPPRVEPSMEEALRGRFSAAPAPKVTLAVCVSVRVCVCVSEVGGRMRGCICGCGVEDVGMGVCAPAHCAPVCLMLTSALRSAEPPDSSALVDQGLQCWACAL